MCGLAGIYNITQDSPLLLDKIKMMISEIKHRGPDEFGVYLDDNITLGSARLSIIDLSGGTQPIHNENEDMWIVYNGEVFNYPDLKSDLIKTGHKFKTATDTEVILHLYEEKGTECLNYLNGQFSFAIWDSTKKELFIARDRVGILPLYYAINSGQFIFASEIKSIIAYLNGNVEIDIEGLDQIFTFWSTIAPKTIYKNIYELKPGHYLKISSGNIKQRKYWDITFSGSKEQNKNSVEENVNEINELLMDAIKIRLRADVPVGSYLSGGLDSSGLTAYIKRNFNNSLRTFGIRFEEENFDEGEYQDEMVSYLNTDHSTITAYNKQIGEELPKVIRQIENPLLRLSPIPLFFLSKVVRENNYKVVVTGEGADEIFGGYDIFKETKIRKFWSIRPESKYRPLLLTKLYPDIFKNQVLSEMLKTFFKAGLDQPDQPFFSHLIRWNNTKRIKNFYSKDVKHFLKFSDVFKIITGELPENFSEWDYLSKAQYLEIKTFLSSYLLSSQGDKVAMANSVEIRVPYLDHRIIEFMSRIPHKYKIRGMNEKYLLKRVYKNLLPKKIIYRTKHPYRAPIKQSIINFNFPYVKELLSERRLKHIGLFDQIKVQKLYQKLEKIETAGEVDSMALCGILTTQIIADSIINYSKYHSTDNISFNLIVDRRNIFRNY